MNTSPDNPSGRGADRILDYGRNDPLLARLARKIPRPSPWTYFLAVAVIVTQIVFWNDQEPWVLERTLPHCSRSLTGRLFADGRRIISDQAIDGWIGGGPYRVVDTARGDVLCTLQIPDDKYADRFCISPDGSRILACVTPIAFASRGDYMQLFDAGSGRLMADYGRSQQWRMFFSADSRRFVLADADVVTLYDAQGKLIAVLHSPPKRQPKEHEFGVSANFLAGSNLVAVYDPPSGTIHVHSLTDGRIISSTPAYFTAAAPLELIMQDAADFGKVLSPAGDRAAVELPHPPHTLTIYDTKTAACLATTRPARDGMIAWLSAKKQIVLYSYSGIDVYDAGTLRLIFSSTTGYGKGFCSLIVSPDSSRAAAIAARHERVAILSTSTWEQTSVIPGNMPGGAEAFTDAAYIRDSRHILTDSDQGEVRLWYMRRPDTIWGIAWLVQFWVAFAAGLLFLCFIIRDVRRWFRLGLR